MLYVVVLFISFYVFKIARFYCANVQNSLDLCLSVSVCVFRLLQEQMENSLSDIQHRLSVKANELQAAHQQIEKLEDKISRSLFPHSLYVLYSPSISLSIVYILLFC